jgi:SAM-dependent methyltransferase
MPPSDSPQRLDQLLDEQVAYYRAIAREYGDHALPFGGRDELLAAVDGFRPTGDVLELACGTGVWTRELLPHATTVTAVDASPEMLDIAAARVVSDRVRFIHADIFTWTPDRRYDVAFFGFWLSHVPPELFSSFWAMVAGCLKPGGRVLFVDDGYRTADELVQGESSSTIRRRSNDGTAHHIVKVPYEPADLERRLAEIGWLVTVRATSGGPFFCGSGRLA